MRVYGPAWPRRVKPARVPKGAARQARKGPERNAWRPAVVPAHAGTKETAGRG